MAAGLSHGAISLEEVINMTKLVRHDPFRQWFTWPRWMDDFESAHAERRGLKIRETDKAIVVEAVVAGIPSDDVEVHIEDGVLTVKAQKSEEKKGKDEYSASSYSYYYTAALSGGAWDKTVADVEDGVLTITIPKAAAAKKRKISVKTKAKK